jgi:hypothetical protein
MHSLDYGLSLASKQMFKLPPPLPKSSNFPTTISATPVHSQRKELTSAFKIRQSQNSLSASTQKSIEVHCKQGWLMYRQIQIVLQCILLSPLCLQGTWKGSRILTSIILIILDHFYAEYLQ